jgi:hypothetical protein
MTPCENSPRCRRYCGYYCLCNTDCCYYPICQSPRKRFIIGISIFSTVLFIYVISLIIILAIYIPLSNEIDDVNQDMQLQKNISTYGYNQTYEYLTQLRNEYDILTTVLAFVYTVMAEIIVLLAAWPFKEYCSARKAGISIWKLDHEIHIYRHLQHAPHIIHDIEPDTEFNGVDPIPSEILPEQI